MALALLRSLPNLLLRRPKTLIHTQLIKPVCKTLTPNFKTLASQTQSRTLVLTKDDRLKSSDDQIQGGSETIAAIVTSLGGGPSAVGIVRVSGPAAVEIAGKVFRPARRGTWGVTSHFVEYGVVLDRDGNLIDEGQSKRIICGANRNRIRDKLPSLCCHLALIHHHWDSSGIGLSGFADCNNRFLAS